MALVFVVVGVVVVFVIAAVVIGRETFRLAGAPPRPVFDVDEAVVWIAEQLPAEVAGQLSHADVRQILHWSLNYLRAAAADERTVAEGETFGYVLEQADRAGMAWSAAEVTAVLDAQAGYLQVIGAAGPA